MQDFHGGGSSSGLTLTEFSSNDRVRISSTGQHFFLWSKAGTSLRLVADIREHGLHEPIVVYENKNPRRQRPDISSPL
jgi:hypothetical protein